MADKNPESQEKNKGGVYWAFKHVCARLSEMIRMRTSHIVITAIILITLIFLFRAPIHPLVMALRTRIFLVILGLPLAILLWKLLFRGRWLKRLIAAAVSIPLLIALGQWGDDAHEYLSLYYRYVTVEKKELTDLPLTDNERIHPLNSIRSLAFEAMNETETPSIPNFVRIGKEYHWTLAIEPAYPIPKTFNGVQEVLSLPATTSSPGFSRERKIRVSLPVGEGLLFSRNSATATIKTFSLWRYLNYQPSGAVYLTDDKGEWVVAVPIIRWKGLFFPRPEFGGVQLIRQTKETSSDLTRLLFLGAGKWIMPEKIPQYSFLSGQNIMPYEVSRYVAHSFRFQEGFLAPLPWYHKGDVRIPDMEDDLNEQPFATYFRIPKRKGILYHYFALEPFDQDKQGLNTSLFIPADGSGPVYFYRHFNRGETLTGVSAIKPKVMESRKMYTWEWHRPVEHRPFIKEIDGKKRFFWLTTVITMKSKAKGSEKKFISGAIPELVITDAANNLSIWVSALIPPDKWIDEIRKGLSPVWGDNKSPTK